MSNFYARYVPPSKKGATTTEPAAQLNGSTKRKRPEQDLAVREPKKQRSVTVAEVKKDDFGVKRFVPKKARPKDGENGSAGRENASTQPESKLAGTGGYEVLEKYKVTGVAKKQNDEADVHIRRPTQKDAVLRINQTAPESVEEPKPNKTKKKRKKSHHEDVELKEDIKDNVTAVENLTEDGFEKHAAVRDRFKKAKKKSEQHQDEHADDSAQNISKPEVHGLEPLPQPLEVEKPYEPPTYSTLPPWLAGADHVTQDNKITFTSLGLSDTVLANLKSNGLVQAMPIQSAVIPLLSRGPTNYDGDLAVAAATGSGKTLAYILPMVEALKDLAVTKLRGIILVPTRELVKQVHESFAMCAEGTSLRATIALGSKSVREEAESLIASYSKYDPAAFEEQQSKKIDWAEFSLVELFDRVTDKTKQVTSHVVQNVSKVDVLICTPGRLVEHLQNTKGFTLDDVQWLVIDEVDRLLNESYQEWLEIVMPALESRRATEVQDKVLRSMSMDIPARKIKKIILSATMTQDLSKLNSLNLKNPKLLALEGDEKYESRKAGNAEDEAAEFTQDATGAFSLPGTLTETAILVGDGSDKPLHLLELFRIQIAKTHSNGTAAEEYDNSSSSSDVSSSDSDSDSKSESSLKSSPPPTEKSSVRRSASKPSQYPSTLIFTRSTEAAPRLSRLLSILDPTLTSKIGVLTRSTTSSASSRKALKSFRAGTTSILITTDRASRGLDIPDIQHVINYDVPSSVQFYVHRVGRTARAAKNGKAWTLLAHREGRWFDQNIAKGPEVRRRTKVSKVTLGGVGKGKEMRTKYEDALKQLGEEVEGK